MNLFPAYNPNVFNIDDCVKYYNSKYTGNCITVVEGHAVDVYVRKNAQEVCEQITGIQSGGDAKICLVVDYTTFKHCTPIITRGKDLFILRDERHNIDFINEIARNLGLNVRALNIQNPETSMQHFESTECDMIAIGILKDTSSEDIALLDGFVNPNPNLLKYTQSLSYVRENFPELLDKEVKEGVTLEQYIRKYNGQRIALKKQKLKSKIQ